MTLHESQYGDARRRPVNSALSGKPLDFGAGDVAIQINGYHLGVKASEWIRATPEQQAAALAQWAANLPEKASKAAPDQPAYDALSLADLKALAKTRGVDVSGKNTKPEIVQAFHFADLQASASSPVPAETAPDMTGLIGE